MANQERFVGIELLLMGSKAFIAERLRAEVAGKMDEAVA